MNAKWLNYLLLFSTIIGIVFLNECECATKLEMDSMDPASLELQQFLESKKVKEDGFFINVRKYD